MSTLICSRANSAPYFERWLARSGYYLPMIQKELESSGLPLDLAYLAMIESGFSQLAYSRSSAVGLWQFMKPTGRQYDLLINTYIDERRDAVKSTRAAVTYLKDLYDEFGDWYLAVAAYNGGPGTIRKAVRGAKSNDFWEIAQRKSLRLETKRYVPKTYCRHSDRQGSREIRIHRSRLRKTARL